MAPGDRWDLATCNTFHTDRHLDGRSVLGTSLLAFYDWDQQMKDYALSIRQDLARSLAPPQITFPVHFLSAA